MQPESEGEVPAEYYDYGDYEDLYTAYGEGYGAYEGFEVEEFIENIIVDNISVYVSPILLFMAAFGNLVSAIVMARLGFRTLSLCLYLAILAVVDMCLLIIRVGNVWAMHIWNQDLTNYILKQSNVSCQVSVPIMVLC